MGIKVIVQLSGGKDSQAALIQAVDRFGSANVIAFFANTGWEHEHTLAHVKYCAEVNGVKLIQKDGDFVALAKYKKRFPSTRVRFCTEHLKVRPFIDYILDELRTDFICVLGVRRDESRKENGSPTR